MGEALSTKIDELHAVALKRITNLKELSKDIDPFADVSFVSDSIPLSSDISEVEGAAKLQIADMIKNMTALPKDPAAKIVMTQKQVKFVLACVKLMYKSTSLTDVLYHIKIFTCALPVCVYPSHDESAVLSKWRSRGSIGLGIHVCRVLRNSNYKGSLVMNLALRPELLLSMVGVHHLLFTIVASTNTLFTNEHKKLASTLLTLIFSKELQTKIKELHDFCLKEGLVQYTVPYHYLPIVVDSFDESINKQQLLLQYAKTSTSAPFVMI